MPKPSKPSWTQRIEATPIIVVFVLLLALFMYTAPEVFLSPNIYTTFLSTLPPLILLAAGLTFVIGAGEIDLCFPSIIAFSGFIFAVLFKEYNLGWLAVIAALAAGLLVGFVNGILVAKVGIPSFIATLGTQFFWAGTEGSHFESLFAGQPVRPYITNYASVPGRTLPRPWATRRCHRTGSRPRS